MRIFTAVRHSKDPHQFYGDLWSSNFIPALRRLGHEVVESKVDLLPTSKFMTIPDRFTKQELAARSQTTETILEELKNEHLKKPIGLFLSYFYNAHFVPDGFDSIRAWGIPSINFYCNSIYQFQLVSQIAKKVDFSWHAEKNARNLYLESGGRPIWVQMAADPEIYRPLPTVKRRPSACFVGQKYADRALWVSALIKANIPIDLYGPGWTGVSEVQDKNPPLETTYLGRKLRQPGSINSYLAAICSDFALHRFDTALGRIYFRLKNYILHPKNTEMFNRFSHASVPFQKIPEIFASHEVCLNFSNVWADGTSASKLVPHVRLRDFEAPMCRTCYITGETEEIREFYEVGREIDTYETIDELIDKTRFYIKNPQSAERLREAGFHRATRDHTWLKRFQELFKKTGLER